MQILKLELRKALRQPSIWLFLALCLAFNVFLVYGQYSPIEGKSKHTPKWMENGTADVFDGYDTTQIAASYIKDGYSENHDNTAKSTTEGNERASLVQPKFIEPLIIWKYQLLQSAADKNALNDESLTPYFGDITVTMHSELFADFMPALCLEGIILAILLMLQSFESENKAENLIVSTKIGRRVVTHKLLATVILDIILWSVAVTLSLCVYFTINDWGGVWSSSVSSGWNTSQAGERPFITWQSFTVRGYLFAVLGVNALLMIVFSLIAYVAWLVTHRAYLTFSLIAFGSVASAILVKYFPATRFVMFETPFLLWNRERFWFTDGDCFIVLPNFELSGIAINLCLLTAMSIFAYKNYKRRNLI
jgi:hypothetical protein